MVNELNDNSPIWKTESRKLLDIWHSTYGIITNHPDITIAIENDLERSLSVHSYCIKVIVINVMLRGTRYCVGDITVHLHALRQSFKRST